MKAWRLTVCAAVAALTSCSVPHRGLPHTVAMPRDGLHSAALKVVNGATTVTVGTAGLGNNLIRVSTPADSGIRPTLAGLPAGVPARLRLEGGAAFATLAGHTSTGVAAGTVLAAAGWARAASRYDIDARAGVSAISVTG